MQMKHSECAYTEPIALIKTLKNQLSPCNDTNREALVYLGTNVISYASVQSDQTPYILLDHSLWFKERSGSVVECLARDRVAAGSSQTERGATRRFWWFIRMFSDSGGSRNCRIGGEGGGRSKPD